jgi:biotin synthase-related radical SAM superfamily protein
MKEMSPERVLGIVNIAAKYPGFEAIAITSGVSDSESETNRQMTEVVQVVRKNYPDLPIGVEGYFTDVSEIQMMKEAGADEIKVNVEAWPEEIFNKVCPTRDRDIIFEALEKAVEVFGRGKVASNIIIGLGETDAEVEQGVTTLAKMGVLANLRGVRVNSINKDPLERALGFLPERVSAERLIELARMQKGVFNNHGVSTLDFRSMCFSCGCCDIVPMLDL